MLSYFARIHEWIHFAIAVDDRRDEDQREPNRCNNRPVSYRPQLFRFRRLASCFPRVLFVFLCGAFPKNTIGGIARFLILYLVALRVRTAFQFLVGLPDSPR